MKNPKPILFCKVLCYSTELDKMGIDSEEWIDFAIDLSRVVAVKSTGDDDGARAVLFIEGGDSFVIENSWKETVKLWHEI